LRWARVARFQTFFNTNAAMREVARKSQAGSMGCLRTRRESCGKSKETQYLSELLVRIPAQYQTSRFEGCLETRTCCGPVEGCVNASTKIPLAVTPETAVPESRRLPFSSLLAVKRYEQPMSKERAQNRRIYRYREEVGAAKHVISMSLAPLRLSRASGASPWKVPEAGMSGMHRSNGRRR